MKSSIKKYAFINAKLRARISKIIDEETINRMIRAHTASEAVQLLKGTDFQIIEEVYSNTGDIRLTELELYKKEIKLYTELEKYLDTETREFLKVLMLRYEIDNLKNTIRLFYDRTIRHRDITGESHYLIQDKIINTLPIDAIIQSSSYNELLAALSATPYQTILAPHTAKAEEMKTLFPLEIALDHYFYQQLTKGITNLEKRDRDIAQRMIGVEIDIQNINWIVRFKNFYNMSLDDAVQYSIPHGFAVSTDVIKQAYSSGTITDILGKIIDKKYSGLRTMLSNQQNDSGSRLILVERILEQIMLYEVRKILSGYPFTIGILLAYFILKGNEIKKIMTILNAKVYRIEPEKIAGVL